MKKPLALLAALTFASVAVAQQDSPPSMPHHGGMPSPEQIFGFMDANQDGFIAKDEAKGPMVQHFDAIDADKDAKISLVELTTAREAMRPPEPPQGEAEEPSE